MGMRSVTVVAVAAWLAAWAVVGDARTTAAAAAEVPDLSGMYACSGAGVHGKAYSCTLEIRAQGAHGAYSALWHFGNENTQWGVGVIRGAALVMAFFSPSGGGVPWGYIEFGNNEMAIVSTVDDPPALRLGAVVWDARALGKLSFNAVRPDGAHEELVLVIAKSAGGYVGELAVFLRAPRRPGDTDDATMRPVLTLRHDGAEFHVPVRMVPPSCRAGEVCR